MSTRNPDLDALVMLITTLDHERLRTVDSTRLEHLERAASTLAARCRIALAERACTARTETVHEEVSA